VDATHVAVAGPASQPRRVHLRRSLEAVQGPNPSEDGPWADWVPKRDSSRLGSHSYGTSLREGFAFWIPAPSAGARSLGGSGPG
jgi:hypothetical protein